MAQPISYKPQALNLCTMTCTLSRFEHNNTYYVQTLVFLVMTKLDIILPKSFLLIVWNKSNSKSYFGKILHTLQASLWNISHYSTFLKKVY